jgi:Photosynthetic reaction centre cytochrome C subunit
MIKANKNKVSVLLSLVALVAFGVAAYNPPKQKTFYGSNNSDTSIYKNLQVLPKDISKDSLDHVMHNFTQSLGVKCMFCHVHNGNDFRQGWDFASDDKPEKNTARFMLKMTAGINSTYFNWNNSAQTDTIHAVTCITCHRGIPHPDAEGIADQMKLLNPSGNMQPPPANNGNQPPPPKN